jgi:hypothetical protein
VGSSDMGASDIGSAGMRWAASAEAAPAASGRRRRTTIRVGGRALAWVTFAAFALVAAIGLLRIFY